MRSRIESIRWAATLVLAACAPPAKVTSPRDADMPAADPGSVEADVPAPDPTAATGAETSPPAPTATLAAPPPPAPPAPPAPPPEPDLSSPARVCHAYRAKVAKTAANPMKQPPPEVVQGAPVQTSLKPGAQDSGERLSDGSVQCTVVWGRRSVQVAAMVTPTCCRRSGPATPCPQPRRQVVAGGEVITETVRIVTGPDGELTAHNRKVSREYFRPPIKRHNCGRRPEGFSMTAGGPRGVAGVLAEMAALEAASVSAFERLARELAHHGAPPELVERAWRAMHDEVRHADTMGALARAHGGEPASWNRATLPIRDRLELGLENAAEGCVSETFGAAVALLQAARAIDPAVREAFRTIAEDELEHAALAWDVHDWLFHTAPPEERARLAEAQRQAVGIVEHGTEDEATRRALGLPTATESRRLLAAVCDELGLAT